MYFGKIIDEVKATDIITYKYISYGDAFYTISKVDIKHDSIKYIARNISNKQATDLIWNDVKNRIQK